MATTANPIRARRERTPTVVANGRRVRLADLPLVAYTLACGHPGRQYAVLKGDQVFCDSCRSTQRVAQILA